MIAFDVGTFVSKVAYVDPNGNPASILNSRGEPRTLSVLHYSPTGAPLVGTDAHEQSFVDPDNTARAFKLQLGTTDNVLRGDRHITATDASADLIGALKSYAETQLDITVAEAVATCPAHFDDAAKQALLEAFERNNITILRLMPEPTAAGFAYAVSKPEADSYDLVYDLGGGTFDTSVLQIDGDEIKVRATEGIARLGGNDLTDCIVTHLLDTAEKKLGIRLMRESHPLAFQDMLQRAEQAKISLGRQRKVPIVISVDGSQLIVEITQNQFHKMIAPHVQQTLEALTKVVSAAGLNFEKINRLILAGGGSRMPYVQNAVAEHTGLVPKVDVDPEMAVAFGGALAAVVELKKQGRSASIHGLAIPAPDVFISDVTAHGVGCCVADQPGPHRMLRNAVIIPKNTPIPCKRMDWFHLLTAEQTEARVEILQGDDSAERKQCLPIGELLLTDLPLEPKRSARIQVEYMIDGNGMVTATATDTISGRHQTVSVDYKRGIVSRPKPVAA